MIVQNKKICYKIWAKTAEKILEFEEFLSSQEIEEIAEYSIEGSSEAVKKLVSAYEYEAE